LGERELCKLEVVGSIPSGSTTFSSAIGDPSKRIRPCIAHGVLLIDIVKKRFVRMPII
jgi:hypothetical protein